MDEKIKLKQEQEEFKVTRTYLCGCINGFEYYIYFLIE